MLGDNKSAISTYESEKVEPTHKNLVRISKFFNVSVDYLLGVIDSPVSAYDEQNILKIPSNISARASKSIKPHLPLSSILSSFLKS